VAGRPPRPSAGQLRPERPRPAGRAHPKAFPRRTTPARRTRGANGPARVVQGPGHPGQLRPVLPGLRRPLIRPNAELGRHRPRPPRSRARHPRPDQLRPRLPPGHRPEGRPLRPEVRRAPPLRGPGRQHQGRLGRLAHPHRRRRPARHRSSRDRRPPRATGRPRLRDHFRHPGRPRPHDTPLRLPARPRRPVDLVPRRPGDITADVARAPAPGKSAPCRGRTSAARTARPSPRAPGATRACTRRPDRAGTARTPGRR
jgi:hypothetical protein